MPTSTMPVGVFGLGSMGSNVAKLLIERSYQPVLYNQTPDKYGQFEAVNGVYLSKDAKDFARKLSEAQGPATVWVMVPGGKVTNEVMKGLSTLLRKKDIVIDASNSIFTDSIANYEVLKKKGIFYLDVGCAGGPDDLLKGVSLMVGGDKMAFEQSKDILKIVAGKGAYGYVGGSGSGHMAKLVHNIIFYGIFAIFAEGDELLLKMKAKKPDFNVNEAQRLLSKSPPINSGIMEAIYATIKDGKLPDGEAPTLTVSSMVESGIKKAAEMDVTLDIIKNVLSGYATMSPNSRKIYGAAKKKLTGH